MELPSNELLSEVLGRKLEYKFTDENKVFYKYWINTSEHEHNINIYELGHMVKEWALPLGYEIKSSSESCEVIHGYYTERDGNNYDVQKHLTEDFDWMDEPEAIFKAGEWIRKELGL